MNTGLICRACGSSSGEVILDLGIQPLANNLLTPADLDRPEPKFPLRLTVCPACWMLQITDLVPTTKLFSEYLYFSSFSDAMVAHAKSATERYMREFGLGSGSFVLEIASNDGYMLQHFCSAAVPCLGIEPAANIAAVAQKKGIPTLVRFFDEECAAQLASEGKQADLILANNVFAHAPDTNAFVAGLRQALKPSGRAVLEFPYAVEMLEKTEFDTIYHEHVFYLTLTAVQPLFQKHGLEIYAVERLPLHGGSLRVFVSHAGTYSMDGSVTVLLAEEARKGIRSLSFYANFAQQVRGLKESLTALLADRRRSGKAVAAYGASAKGSTLLNFCGLGCETIEFVADRSPYKQGRLTPGTHIPIVAAEELAQRRPDYALLLTWNFAEEILEQQRAYRREGGQFIIPIPRVITV
jgi:SAM-dependent methyltransferase